MHTIIHADIITALARFEPNTFDAVLCDPPYGLSFMNAEWDYQVPDAELWRAVFRVLKPGAHLIAFSSTRTYHRAVVEIEDAGFEIRDQLAWLYATGFPKSLDVAKAIDKQRFDRDDVLKVTRWVRETAKKNRVSNARIDAAFGFVGMAGHWTSAKSQPSVPTLEQVPTLLAALGTDDVPDDVKRLLYDLNGRKRQPGENWFKREVLGHRPGLLGSGFGDTGHGLHSAPDAVAVTASASDAAREWAGYGTALKPAYEPAVLARKPLEGTVAENVRKWGVGALAIDACRIGRAPDDEQSGWASTGSKASENRAMSGANYAREPKEDADARWPSNLLLDAEAGVMLDAQSGERPGGAFPTVTAPRSMLGLGGYVDPKGARAMGDTGGASRFFFCPKASTEERDLGCSALPLRSTGNHALALVRDALRRERRAAGLESPRAGAGRNNGARNHHPTVKPVDLMRYLARLIMPPTPGKLLVPFSGSGSEMIGARLAGWEDITGVEWNEEFVQIARARVALAEKKPGLFEKAIRATRNKNMRALSERFTQQNVPRVLGRKR